jgi:hypothetical protein
VATPEPGRFRVAVDSDGNCFGGQGRVGWDADHFTTPAEAGGFKGRDQYMQVGGRAGQRAGARPARGVVNCAGVLGGKAVSGWAWQGGMVAGWLEVDACPRS